MNQVFNIKNGLFYGLLNLDEFSKSCNISVKREVELKGRAYLLEHMLGSEAEIYYDAKGKPHLKNDARFISISHSHGKLAIIINETEPTGIDIELIREKILKIKHKFLSDKELEDCEEDVEKLLIHWAAKETLYKIYGLREVDFSKNLLIKPFAKHNLGTIIGSIHMPSFKESFELHYQIMENYVLVYALNKL